MGGITNNIFASRFNVANALANAANKPSKDQQKDSLDIAEGRKQMDRPGDMAMMSYEQESRLMLSSLMISVSRDLNDVYNETLKS